MDKFDDKKNFSTTKDNFEAELSSRGITNLEFSINEKSNPSQEDVDKYIGYAAFQIERGNLDNALDLLDRAIQLDDKATLAYANKGTLYYKKGELKTAVAFFDKALSIDATNIKILESKMNCLSEILPEVGEQVFINAVNDCLKVDPSNFTARLYSIQFHLKNNDVENSLKGLKYILAVHFKDDLVIELLNNTFSLIDDNEIAFKEYAKLEAGLDHNQKYQLTYYKGLYLKEKCNYDESIKVFNYLNDLYTYSWNYYQIAIIKNLQSKIDECLFFLCKTFELEPELKEDAKTYFQLENLWDNSEFVKLVN
ncbi:tetratricopeptide repeat protein [Aquimarina agarivorans]|uniref:tetratricopeptide repeat protein n=1 Tax=Aquimarina agarivorans TaxID=980584 RepID=UPI000248F2B3|nr:hypothetical protein [Aquimarina agarivorans]